MRIVQYDQKLQNSYLMEPQLSVNTISVNAESDQYTVLLPFLK